MWQAHLFRKTGGRLVSQPLSSKAYWDKSLFWRLTPPRLHVLSREVPAQVTRFLSSFLDTTQKFPLNLFQIIFSSGSWPHLNAVSSFHFSFFGYF